MWHTWVASMRRVHGSWLWGLHHWLRQTGWLIELQQSYATVHQVGNAWEDAEEGGQKGQPIAPRHVVKVWLWHPHAVLVYCNSKQHQGSSLKGSCKANIRNIQYKKQSLCKSYKNHNDIFFTWGTQSGTNEQHCACQLPQWSNFHDIGFY